MLTQDDILQIYRERNAVWFFDYRRGVPHAPHALLASGLHSDGYVNSTPVMQDPQLVETLAGALIELLWRRNVLPVGWVVGSPYAAITFSYEVARQLGAKHGFAEKNPGYGEPPFEPRFIWNRFQIPSDVWVLQVEELITTLGTALDVKKAVEKGNCDPVHFLPEVGTVIYRPQSLRDNPVDVISLVAREVRSWHPDECLLCEQGSTAVLPKSNWAALTGRAV